MMESRARSPSMASHPTFPGIVVPFELPGPLADTGARQPTDR